MLIDTKANDDDFYYFLAWEWVNTQGVRSLTSLGDLPMRPKVGDLDGGGDLDVFSAAGDFEFHLWLNRGDGRPQ